MGYLHSIPLLVVALVALSSSPVLADARANQVRAEEIVSGRCFMCHGMEGESASSIFPRLAGQHAEYVARQLDDFKSGKRKSETMKSQVEDLTPEEMKALGAFFENKEVAAKPAAGTDTEILAVGRYIFDQGNAYSGVPGCASGGASRQAAIVSAASSRASWVASSKACCAGSRLSASARVRGR